MDELDINDLVDDKVEAPMKVKKQPTDTDWTTYVVEQLSPDEFVEGHPNVAGLRRVTELLFGEIIDSQTEVVQAPDSNYKNCTVTHVVSVLKYSTQKMITVSAAVDVTLNNTPPPFNKFLVGTADSRAEAKALRRLLKLNIVTAEELGKQEDLIPIAPEQIIAISKLCERNNLDVLKVLKKFGTFKSIDDVTRATALDVIKSLSAYQNDETVFTKSFKGFKKDWRNS